MAASGSSGLLLVATGGREQPVRVWDSQHTQTPLFSAKNVSRIYTVESWYIYVLSHSLCVCVR